tara:strand:+ start:616 stop:1188 length:573 start_codon:yes stop_codon:yes gene_type:complete
VDKIANLNFPTPKANMQLRSGKIVDSASTKSHSSMHLNRTRDPTYNPSPLEMAKYKVREDVRKRQRAIADKHTEKAVDQIRGALQMFIKEFNNQENTKDSALNKIRVITFMFKYANSKSTYTMMHHRLMRVRSTMLTQCVNLAKQAEDHINARIVKGVPAYAGSNEYYESHLRAMNHELTTFKETYANRL